MAQLRGVRETLAAVWYDTMVFDGMERGVTRLFGNAHVGDAELSNLQIAGQLGPGGPSIVRALGLRIPYTTRDEEDVLLDHFRVRPVMGDKPYGDYHGSLLSTGRNFAFEDWVTLRIQILYPDIRQKAKDGDCPIEVNDLESAAVALDWMLDRGEEIEAEIPQLPGYQFGRPIVVPTRQGFYAEVACARIDELRATWQSFEKNVPLMARVSFLGLLTREVL
jgi:hypothetical protein